jgi:hypothetical protein
VHQDDITLIQARQSHPHELASLAEADGIVPVLELWHLTQLGAHLGYLQDIFQTGKQASWQLLGPAFPMMLVSIQLKTATMGHL